MYEIAERSALSCVQRRALPNLLSRGSLSLFLKELEHDAEEAARHPRSQRWLDDDAASAAVPHAGEREAERFCRHACIPLPA
jgi:hypothetical protein